MIYELRTYTLRAGAGPTVAKNAGGVGRAIRGDDYGKLEGYWLTEIGPLNRVMHLWSYADLNERHRLRGELAKNERWTKEYVPLIREHLVRQDVRLLDPILPLKAPASEGNVYEYRNYRTAPGRVREWARHFQAIMPMREEYSKNVGAWITRGGAAERGLPPVGLPVGGRAHRAAGGGRGGPALEGVPGEGRAATRGDALDDPPAGRPLAPEVGSGLVAPSSGLRVFRADGIPGEWEGEPAPCA